MIKGLCEEPEVELLELKRDKLFKIEVEEEVVVLSFTSGLGAVDSVLFKLDITVGGWGLIIKGRDKTIIRPNKISDINNIKLIIVFFLNIGYAFPRHNISGFPPVASAFISVQYNYPFSRVILCLSMDILPLCPLWLNIFNQSLTLLDKNRPAAFW